MKNDKITITYKHEEDRTLCCYPPRSKYRLMKNLGIVGFFAAFALISNIVLYTRLTVTDNTSYLCTFLTLCILGIVSYDAYDEWSKGYNYKYALHIVNKYTTAEEREKWIKELSKR